MQNHVTNAYELAKTFSQDYVRPTLRNTRIAAEDGIAPGARLSVLIDEIEKLPNKVFLSTIFSSDKTAALRMISTHQSQADLRANAQAVFSCLSVTRAVILMLQSQSLTYHQHQTLAALRFRFVPGTEDINEIRTAISVSLENGKDLRTTVGSSSSPTIRCQKHFISKLCDVLNALDLFARDLEYSHYLVSPNSSWNRHIDRYVVNQIQNVITYANPNRQPRDRVIEARPNSLSSLTAPAPQDRSSNV
jgi:hypothetical protein